MLMAQTLMGMQAGASAREDVLQGHSSAVGSGALPLQGWVDGLSATCTSLHRSNAGEGDNTFTSPMLLERANCLGQGQWADARANANGIHGATAAEMSLVACMCAAKWIGQIASLTFYISPHMRLHNTVAEADFSKIVSKEMQWVPMLNALLALGSKPFDVEVCLPEASFSYHVEFCWECQ